MKNARFWVFHRESMVKLTLLPGETVTITTGGEADEGYHYACETYEYDKDEGLVVNEISTKSLDCDGPLSTYSKFVCPIDKLQAREEEDIDLGHGVIFHRMPTPDWQEEARYQRDYYAESMGY